MRGKGFILAAAMIASVGANAANDVYGTVSEMHLRSGDNGDESVYFRLDVIEDYSQFENCIENGNTMTWHVNPLSSVTDYQFGIIKDSYLNQKPVRVIGFESVCDDGKTNTDKIFELSPWGWHNN